jgi:lipid A 3-O-deacylase
MTKKFADSYPLDHTVAAQTSDNCHHGRTRPSHAVQARLGAIAAFVLGVFAMPEKAWASGIQSAMHALTPAGIFLQVGEGDQNTQSYAGGLTWQPSCQFRLGPMVLSGYVEATFGKWFTRDLPGVDHRWVSQYELAPVMRARPDGAWNALFAEVGIGTNYIDPLFNTEHKQFSTRFQFGDHFGVGIDLGSHELAVRVEHFSNASIRDPNPGENFVQLRYAYRFRSPR